LARPLLSQVAKLITRHSTLDITDIARHTHFQRTGLLWSVSSGRSTGFRYAVHTVQPSLYVRRYGGLCCLVRSSIIAHNQDERRVMDSQTRVAVDLDDLPMDVFQLSGNDFEVELLTAGHGMTEATASSNCFCYICCSCCC
jgi:hypothetical protein